VGPHPPSRGGFKRHPTIGDGILLGAGAKVIGPIRVGADSRVGSNALVVHDVPPGPVVTGVVADAIDPVA
jgi:serine O-acetyltransferase